MPFTEKVEIPLWDRDDPGFPLYDDRDWLGTVTIRTRPEGSGLGKYTRDDADYTLTYTVMKPSECVGDHGDGGTPPTGGTGNNPTAGEIEGFLHEIRGLLRR